MGQTCGCACERGIGETESPAGTPALTPEDTVAAAARRAPNGGLRLRSLGIDTCYGGQLTLAQAAVAAGIPVERVLQAVEVAASVT